MMDAIDQPEEVTKNLIEFEVIVAMRERTRFDTGLIGRLKNLRLLITTGMRNNAMLQKKISGYFTSMSWKFIGLVGR